MVRERILNLQDWIYQQRKSFSAFFLSCGGRAGRFAVILELIDKLIGLIIWLLYS